MTKKTQIYSLREALCNHGPDGHLPGRNGGPGGAEERMSNRMLRECTYFALGKTPAASRISNLKGDSGGGVVGRIAGGQRVLIGVTSLVGKCWQLIPFK